MNSNFIILLPGAQFKVLVEYAPSQCVPKPSSKKDGREGTISKGTFFFSFFLFLCILIVHVLVKLDMLWLICVSFLCFNHKQFFDE